MATGSVMKCTLSTVLFLFLVKCVNAMDGEKSQQNYIAHSVHIESQSTDANHASFVNTTHIHI